MVDIGAWVTAHEGVCLNGVRQREHYLFMETSVQVGLCLEVVFIVILSYNSRQSFSSGRFVLSQVVEFSLNRSQMYFNQT